MEKQAYTIQELLLQFRNLNAVYAAIIERGNIHYSEQVLITQFHQQFQEVPRFERMLIELMIATEKNTYERLFDNLHSEILKSIGHFE